MNITSLQLKTLYQLLLAQQDEIQLQTEDVTRLRQENGQLKASLQHLQSVNGHEVSDALLDRES
jgi:hypothetical protein